MDEMNLATELLHEVKRSAQRWFIAFCAMIALEFGTIVGFMWYISLPAEETHIEQNMDDVDGDNARQFVGGDPYGKIDTESNKDSQNNEK